LPPTEPEEPEEPGEPDKPEEPGEPGDQPGAGVATPIFTPTPTASALATATTTALATATATAAGGGTAPTATATPTPSQSGGGSPPPPPLGGIAEQGLLYADIIAVGALGNNSGHAWELTVQQSGTITVSAIADLETNIALTIERPNGSAVVNNLNDAGIGEAETAVFTADAGVYRVIVTAVSGNGDYALLALNELSFSTVLVGNLRYGDSLDATMPERTDHYWHFSGAAGDVISIIVTPSGIADMLFVLFDPEGNIVGEYVDDGQDGEPEALRNVTLPLTGYYSILLQEFFAESAEYRIELIRN
jgi:hypothetical protein